MATTRTVYEWFMESVRAHPEQPGLRIAGTEFSYQDLYLASASVAGRVLGPDRRRPRRVGVITSRTAGTYVSYLAGQRLGAAVVPINSEFPLSRNSVVVTAAELDVLLCPPQAADRAAELAGATGTRLIVLPADEDLLAGAGVAEDHGVPHLAESDDLAYILFTSGSTGAPKGVPIKHSCVSAYLSQVIPYYAAGPGSRLALTSELTFDLSCFAMFVAWGSAAAIDVPAKLDLLEPARYVAENEITHWLSVPSVVSMARQLQSLPPGSMPTLRWSLFLGEQLTVEQARAWFEAAPQSTVENLYGPTEVTISCNSYSLPPDPSAWPAVNGAVPIGDPYPLVECLVVHEAGHESLDGELLLRGAQRFDGYLDPALNAGRFVSWDGKRAHVYDGTGPLTPDHWYRTGDRVRIVDGELFHLGRLDNQLKVQGYRIEPGEIEAAMRAHDSVDEAVVVPCPAGDGEIDLAAAYTGRPVPAADLAEFMAGRMPAHMVPEFFVWMETFPLNVNGKVDRPRLTSDAPGWTASS